MIKVTQNMGGTGRKFIVKKPTRIEFWTEMANLYPWIKDEMGTYGIKIKQLKGG